MLYLEMIILVIVSIIYIKLLYNKFGNSIPFLILFLIYAFWAIFSIVYIDNGTYISEQNTKSYFTGSAFRLIVIIAPFLICAPVFFCKFSQKYEKNLKENEVKSNEKLYTILQIIGSILLVYLYINIFISGIPLFNKGVTNFNFYKVYSKMPLASTLQSTFLQYFILINGIILCDKKSSKKSKICSIVFYICCLLYRILFGEKFYPFLIYTLWFFMPILTQYFSKQRNEGFINKKIIFICIGFLMTLLVVVYIKYAVESSKKPNSNSPLEHLIERTFSLQSHMFWGYDRYLTENNMKGINWENIGNELLAGIKNTSKFDSNIGLTKIMYIISPQNIVDRYINNMTRFYGGYWTLAIGMFGYILSPLYSIFVAFIFAYYASKFSIALKEKSFFLLFLTSSCYYIVFTYFNEANFSYLFSKRMVLYTIIILLYPQIYDKYQKYSKIFIKKLKERKKIKSE